METAPNNTTVSLKSKKAILTTLHYQYSDWKRLLGFYAGELKLLEKRAGEYETEAPNENNSTTEMEHFYNQFGMLNTPVGNQPEFQVMNEFPDNPLENVEDSYFDMEMEMIREQEQGHQHQQRRNEPDEDINGSSSRSRPRGL